MMMWFKVESTLHDRCENVETFSNAIIRLIRFSSKRTLRSYHFSSDGIKYTTHTWKRNERLEIEWKINFNIYFDKRISIDFELSKYLFKSKNTRTMRETLMI